MMKLFQLIESLDPEINPKHCKIHLAVSMGERDPLELYFSGMQAFNEQQEWQKQRNFERAFVLTLVKLPEHGKWLFVGVFDSLSSVWHESVKCYKYRLSPRAVLKELQGRLIVRYERKDRQSFRDADNLVDAMTISEYRPERLATKEFPGYSWAMLTKRELDVVVKQEIASWKGALSNVAGVYVIADRATGKLYVGSATGDGGIWNRWCDYSESGHGGNRGLRKLLSKREQDYANKNFQFGILEIANTYASDKDVLKRESRWKDLLLTRDYGYNAN